MKNFFKLKRCEKKKKKQTKKTNKQKETVVKV